MLSAVHVPGQGPATLDVPNTGSDKAKEFKAFVQKTTPGDDLITVLANVETWRLGDEESRTEVFDRLHELVLKPVDGSGGKGIVIGPRATRAELDELRGKGQGDQEVQQRIAELDMLLSAAVSSVLHDPAVAVIFGLGIFPVEARAIVPVGGMMVGNAMTSTVLAGRRIVSERVGASA